MSSIATKKGDGGQTSLTGGIWFEIIHSCRAYGTVDGANSAMGLRALSARTLIYANAPNSFSGNCSTSAGSCYSSGKSQR